MKRPLTKHYGQVKNGKLYLQNLNLYNKNVMSLDGKFIELTIDEKHEDPTPNQHAFFNGVIVPAALSIETFGGWTRTEFINFMKDEFGLSHTKVREYKGKEVVIKVKESLSGLSKKRLSEFIDNVIKFLENEGLEIKSPENYKYDKHSS